ncbi:MAG: D-serine ammonia-lyase [Spirochaetia bacterium]|jgi:D-serine dehydratase|nr:D-serine ammonia-lyase [Spirochaetia bacterium]
MDISTQTVIEKVLARESLYWENPSACSLANRGILNDKRTGLKEIIDASNRLERFKPFIKAVFPETNDGTIESPLKPAPFFSEKVLKINNSFYIKCDNLLQAAGSVKARGGIYEILKHAEDLALENNLITTDSDYSIFAENPMKEFFSKYHVVVGSTGNLGMSIGIISAKLGFKVSVHMSNDAKEWKKNKLRKLGVNVVEHKGSYADAVEQGRISSLEDPYSYFVDDENSMQLFLGYSTAALRLEKQLNEAGIKVDRENPLYVYLPCGVGGAPGGICFGLKHVFGENVKCYFAEPVNAPSVLLGFLEGKKINFRDYGFIMKTDADGLAVDSPSELVLETCRDLTDGFYTVSDKQMYANLYQLKEYEYEKIEVSAAASLSGPKITGKGKLKGTHIAWLTGGIFIPDDEYNVMFEKGRIAAGGI